MLRKKKESRGTPNEILGRYRIEKQIGAGMMGTVYRGRDTLIDRPVAIKAIRLPSGGSSDSDVKALRDRFLVEARAAGRIAHPNVVTLYDVAQAGDDFFLIFEFVEGKPLSDRLKKGRLDPERARRIAAAAARGLAAAHALGVVHRDIKPANLILADDDRVKIADFGVARVEDSHLTQTGQTVGTPAYMSPEQAQGKKLDGRSDVFSLAVVLYEMLTGTNPFAAGNAPAAMLKVAYEEPPPIQDLAPDVPDGFETIVRWALGKDPRGRPDAAAFAAELEGLPIRPPEPARAAAAARPRAPSSPARTAWSVGRGLVLAAVVLAGWLLYPVLRDPYRVARTAMKEARYPAAIDALQRAGVERGDDPERHLLLVLAALQGKDYRRARAAVDSLLSFDPSFRDRLSLAALFDTAEIARRADHRQAAADLREMARVLPPDPGLERMRARHLWQSGNREEAVRLLEVAGVDRPLTGLYAFDLEHEDCEVRRRAALWYAEHPAGAPVEMLRRAYARAEVTTNTRAGWLGRILPKKETTYACDREALARALTAAGAPPGNDPPG